MGVYLYPKTRHTRRLRPARQFKNYRVYKPILRAEFVRICVYCRQPDCQAKGQVFGVDHYRPKAGFPALVCAYDNLFYACNTCNTYKGDYWPGAGAAHRVLNPCDDELSRHVRFDARTGRMESLSNLGAFFTEMFRLNEGDAPGSRLACLEAVQLAKDKIRQIDLGLAKVAARLAGVVAPADQVALESKKEALETRRTRLVDLIDRQTGSLPLPPLSARHVAPP